MSKEIRKYKVDSELYKDFKDNCILYANEDLFVYPEGQYCAMPESYKEIEDNILNMEVFPDDIWLLTFPKCGTTWSQEMIWMIQNDVDYEGCKVNVILRFPFLEISGLGKTLISILGINSDSSVQAVKDMKRPRMIKSHLPVGLLPRQLWQVKPKIIFVLREPKDVAASWLNHYMVVFGYKGTPEKFYEAFISDSILYGSFWGYFTPLWKMRHEPNVLFYSFEDMKKNLPDIVRRTAKFLGKTVPEDKLEGLLQHLDFSNMKNNHYVDGNSFVSLLKKYHGVAKDQHLMNKGEVGNYKKKMSPEWIKRFDEWCKQEKVKYGLDKEEEFPY